MKVRITAAAKETYWYAKHIGEEFEVVRISPSQYVVFKSLPHKPMTAHKFINVSDCEVITETKKAVHKCRDCTHLWFRMANTVDTPYDEYACNKNHWDTVEDIGSLDDEIDCPDFLSRKPKPKLREPLTEDPTGDSDMNYSDADPGL